MILHLSIKVTPAIMGGPGTIGASRPAVWRHFIRPEKGPWLFAQLLADTNHDQPDYETLAKHAAAHPSLWVVLPAPASSTSH